MDRLERALGRLGERADEGPGGTDEALSGRLAERLEIAENRIADLETENAALRQVKDQAGARVDSAIRQIEAVLED